MAAPSDITIKNLNGEWVMDATMSDNPDPILALQGMSWFLRTALPYATVTLHVHEYADTENEAVYHVDIDQVITGGIQGSKERRQLDWEERDHVDNIFGNLKGRSRFLRGGQGEDGKVRPKVEVQTNVGEEEADQRVRRFLTGVVMRDGTSESEGFLVDEEGDEFGSGEGLWLQSFVINHEYGWTAEQIWGFEVVDGERRHSRRVAVAKDGQVEMARLVYTFNAYRTEDAATEEAA